MSLNFDLNRFQADQNTLLMALSNDPIQFVKNFYVHTNNQIYSSYSAFNNPDLCCLIDKSNLSLKYNSTICSTVKLINSSTINSDLVHSYLVTNLTTNYLLKVLPINDVNIVIKDLPSLVIQELLKNDTLLTSCMGFSIDNLKYIGSDDFTNHSLISLLLNYLFTSLAPSLTTYLTCFSCSLCSIFEPSPFGNIYNLYGVNLLEAIDLGSLDKIGIDQSFSIYRQVKRINSDQPNKYTEIQIVNPDIILSIIKQVILTLSFLQTSVHFIHGNLKANDILISSSPLTTSYAGISIDSPFTCKLSNFSKSSLTFALSDGNYRFYNNLWLSDIFTAIQPFNPVLISNHAQPYYIIKDNFTAQLFIRSRSMGLPFYPTFDTYTFLVSFFLIPQIFHSIFTNDILKSTIWDILWYPDDISTIYNKLKNSIYSNSPNSFPTIFNLLKGLKLKCNITDLLVDQLRSNKL